jgi:hypothetical protein
MYNKLTFDILSEQISELIYIYNKSNIPEHYLNKINLTPFNPDTIKLEIGLTNPNKKNDVVYSFLISEYGYIYNMDVKAHKLNNTVHEWIKNIRSSNKVKIINIYDNGILYSSSY